MSVTREPLSFALCKLRNIIKGIIGTAASYPKLGSYANASNNRAFSIPEDRAETLAKKTRARAHLDAVRPRGLQLRVVLFVVAREIDGHAALQALQARHGEADAEPIHTADQQMT